MVAFAGLLLGLFAIFDESSRTWFTLGYLGFSRKQFLLTAGLEGAAIGMGAWISGSLVGALGWLLINVINVQSFGWTLQWHLPWTDFVIFGLLLFVIGFLSGVFSAALWIRKQKMKFLFFNYFFIFQILSAEWIQPPLIIPQKVTWFQVLIIRQTFPKIMALTRNTGLNGGTG